MWSLIPSGAKASITPPEKSMTPADRRAFMMLFLRPRSFLMVDMRDARDVLKIRKLRTSTSAVILRAGTDREITPRATRCA